MDGELLRYRQYQRSLIDDIVPSTIHFLRIDENNIPHPHGSGVLVQIDDYYFVFTAAHVIEDSNDTIGVGFLENKFKTLGGVKMFNTTSSREVDTIDVGIIELDQNTVEHLKSLYKFIQKDELGINHTPVYNPQYVAVGYPATKSKYNRYKNELRSSPFNYITMPVNPLTSVKVKPNLATQILVHYEQKAMRDYQTGLRQKGPDSPGMSGCGFWHLPISGLIKNTNEKKLVSILTDWRNVNFWLGAKVDVFTEIIRKNYDVNLPASNSINLNLES